MSAALEVAKRPATTSVATRPPTALGRAELPALSRRLAMRLGTRWVPGIAWTVGRTGRAGLVGIALLLAAGLFFVSTYLKVAAEVAALRSDVAAAQERRVAPADNVGNRPTAARPLPARTDMPAILRQLFNKATQARLAVDAGRYETNATTSSGVVRYPIAFAVTGPYPQIREFIDATLATMPEVALTDLALSRKSIADGNVEAQLRMTVYTAAGTPGQPGARAGGQARGASPSLAAAAEPAVAPPPLADAPRAAEARASSDRVAPPTHAAALFAQHSWFVAKPAPPPPPPPAAPAPPEPTAPPFPYAFVGSYAPTGSPPVFFLSRGDRVIDARVGDQLDGVYRFESAVGGQLVFVYLPLNVRHTVPAGGTK